MISQFVWNVLRYKAVIPGFVICLLLLFHNYDVLFQRRDLIDLAALKEKLRSKRLQFPDQSDVPFDRYQLNVSVSNKLSIDRDVPDTRPSECLSKSYYLSQLPNTSIIIPFHNEAWSMLLRTIHSVIFRTPQILIDEIILIDDQSTYEYLKKPLQDYLRGIPKVRLIRTSAREGLIRARMIGAKLATGRVLVFLDAHVEVGPGWLEPLLEAVSVDRTRIAVPHIHRIDPRSLAYNPWEPIAHGSFAWTMDYVWKDVPHWAKKSKTSKIDPILTATMIGCTFIVDRIYFFELGGFDEGMLIWGGENLEISFRTWMCGGSMYIYPCSNIAHVFRLFLPYTFPNDQGGSKIIKKNYQRIAEVWMDEFKPFYYAATKDIIPFTTKKEKYSLQHRKEIRKKLTCKTFKWYLDNIARDVVQPRMDSQYQGEIRNAISRLCLKVDPASRFVLFSPCHGERKFEHFHFTNRSLIHHNNSHCISVRSGKQVPVVDKCDPSNPTQVWKLIEGYPKNITDRLGRPDSRYPLVRLENQATGLCITQITVQGSEVQVPGYTVCNPYEVFQYWIFSYKFDFSFNTSPLSSV